MWCCYQQDMVSLPTRYGVVINKIWSCYQQDMVLLPMRYDFVTSKIPHLPNIELVAFCEVVCAVCVFARSLGWQESVVQGHSIVVPDVQGLLEVSFLATVCSQSVVVPVMKN